MDLILWRHAEAEPGEPEFQPEPGELDPPQMLLAR